MCCLIDDTFRVFLFLSGNRYFYITRGVGSDDLDEDQFNERKF